MTPERAEVQAVSETYELLRVAAARRQPVAAIYDGLLRLLCPRVLGRKSGRLHVFCYQFGGNSASGLATPSEGIGAWRWLAVVKLHQVELRVDAWHTERRAPHQTGMDEIDFDADVQPGEDPQ
ncbi:MAG TPA: hypothetical protein VIX37_23560 [Candidatus Sulfotelmatobacter sp.]